jgi:hypothetical protein
VVIAKIGTLPETLESRSIVIPMRRRRPDESIEPVRPEDHETFARLGRMAARWSSDNAEVLANALPELPSGLFNRTRDNWRPLIAIADAVGGQWPDRARRVAVLLSGSAEDPSLGIQLLSDIREIFRSGRRSSEDLCEDLLGLEDRPWAEDGLGINPRRLAQLLKGCRRVKEPRAQSDCSPLAGRRNRHSWGNRRSRLWSSFLGRRFGAGGDNEVSEGAMRTIVTPFPPDYRASGVLMHVVSLPSPGVGDLGPGALA